MCLDFAATPEDTCNATQGTQDRERRLALMMIFSLVNNSIRKHGNIMELDALQAQLHDLLEQAAENFQKVPGSAVLVRYIQSSYQNDPVRSAIELVLVLFFIRYLLSPSYSTHKLNYVKLREDVRTHRLSRLIDNRSLLDRRLKSWSRIGPLNHSSPSRHPLRWPRARNSQSWSGM